MRTEIKLRLLKLLELFWGCVLVTIMGVLLYIGSIIVAVLLYIGLLILERAVGVKFG